MKETVTDAEAIAKQVVTRAGAGQYPDALGGTATQNEAGLQILV
jgi:hypothetical protein